MAQVSILCYQHPKHQGHTSIEASIMCVTPFAWIHDIQSLEKLFRWKSLGNCTCNLIRKFDNLFPWSKVTGFPFNDMSSPRQFKLDQYKYTSDCISGSDAAISGCWVSRVFSSRVFLDSNCVYLEDKSRPLVERAGGLAGMSDISGGAEGSRGVNASSRLTISRKLELQKWKNCTIHVFPK